MASRIGILAVVLCVTVAAALSQDTTPGPIHPPDPGKARSNPVMDFGVVGLVAGQTARLSIVNVDPPEPDLPPGPCRVELAFFYPDGSEAMSKRFDLIPGESAFIDLPAREFSLVRGKATIIGPDRLLPPGPCRAGLEVFDNESQQTKLILSPAVIRGFNPQPDPPGKQGRVPPGADKGFNPQPDPPGFPMIGMTRGQSLRVNIANVATPGPDGYPPDPCHAVISFLDDQGNVSQEGVTVHVESGKAVVVTFEPSLGEGRKQVRAHVTYLPTDPARGGFPPDPCKPVASLELVDTRTGQSSLILSPATIRGFNPQPDPPGVPGGIIGPDANR